jgi:hypothetical protein
MPIHEKLRFSGWNGVSGNGGLQGTAPDDDPL